MKEAVERRPRRRKARGAAQGMDERPRLVLYTVARHRHNGTELLRSRSLIDEDTLPVFSSRAAAEDRLDPALREGQWYVRESYAGELISLIFGLYDRVEWVSVDPSPVDPETDAPPPNLVYWKSFVNDLMEQRCATSGPPRDAAGSPANPDRATVPPAIRHLRTGGSRT